MHKIIFILIISGISLLLGGCKEGTILSSLNQRQSNEVLAALHKHQIQAVKVPQGKGLFTISVPEEQSRQAIHILQEYHLPSNCLLYTSPSPRDRQKSRMPSSA